MERAVGIGATVDAIFFPMRPKKNSHQKFALQVTDFGLHSC
jgi:hypothetical protein